MDIAPKKQYILQSVDNALRLLDLLAAHGPLTLSEIARLGGYGKTIAYRLLYTLEARGYVVRGTDNRYALGMRLFTLGNRVRAGKDFLPLVQPLLDGLTVRVQETSHLVIWENLYHVILLYESLPQQTLRAAMDGSVASRPPHLTSTGMALLSTASDEQLEDYARVMLSGSHTPPYTPAQLREDVRFVREHGYAINNQRYERGMVSIAVPVRVSGDRQADLAISISGPSTRVLDAQPLILRELSATAAAIRRLL